MKTKLIERINSIYKQIQASEEQLKKDLEAENIDRVNKLNLGTRGLKLQELNISLFNTIDIYLNVAEGCMCDFSDELNNYYSLYQDLLKPSSETDSEEIKKIKEAINSYKAESKET